MEKPSGTPSVSPSPKGSRRRKRRSKNVGGIVAGLSALLLLATGLLLWGLGVFKGKKPDATSRAPETVSQAAMPREELLHQLASQYLVVHSISPSRLKIESLESQLLESEKLAVITGIVTDLSDADNPDSKVTQRIEMGLELGPAFWQPPSAAILVGLNQVAPLIKLKIGERVIAEKPWPIGEAAWQQAIANRN